MFNRFKSLFTPKVKPEIAPKQWKAGMWVVYQTKVFILHKIDLLCEIHSVDNVTGETTGILGVPLESLRQATYDEIPVVRRGITREQAKELGYGS